MIWLTKKLRLRNRCTLSDGAGRRQIRIKALKVWPTAAGFPGPTRLDWGYAETRRVRSVRWGHGRKDREAWSVPVLSSTDSDNLQSPARTFDINFDIIGADSSEFRIEQP